MNKDVLVKISGLQGATDGGECVELMARGKYYRKNEKHYLLYDDIEEESGMTTKNTIKFNEEKVEVLRNGMVNGKLVFDEGKNSQSLYGTPYGDILLEVLTKKISVEELTDHINLLIEYELYADNTKVTDSRIVVNINEQ
ncbi:MAG: DUF1934 domain-containing protein [Eubacterium sp.]|nr:DUF1934 domain-containing protein [Eubacterium sp.]